MAVDLDWDAFLDTLTQGTRDLAEATLDGVTDQAIKDARSFASFSETKLKKWSKALSEGQIDREDFDFLVSGLASLAKLHALTAKGITAKKLDNFRAALLSLVVDSVFDLVLPG